MPDPSDMRAAWLSLGRQLARLREAAGYTQATLAPVTGYTRSSIANIETGLQPAARPFWLQCDVLLHADGALISRYDALAATRPRPGPRGKTPAETSTNAPSDTATADDDELSLIERRRRLLADSNLDEAKLEYLERAVHAAIADNERRPPAQLAAHVRYLRTYVDELLDGRAHPPQQARLYVAAGYLSGLMAALVLDVGGFHRAGAYGAEAFELADAVGHRDLQAWARGVQSLVAYYAGQYHDALAYARDGQRRAPGGPQSIRLAVNGEARALARLGDAYGVDDAIERGFALVQEQTGQSTVSASLSIEPYCIARSTANAATAYLALGAVHRAVSYATQALTAFDHADLVGPRALTRLDLATAALQDPHPEVEHACTLVAEAMTITAEHRFQSVRQRAHEFLTIARPWQKHTAVREVTEAITDRARTALSSTAAYDHNHDRT